MHPEVIKDGPGKCDVCGMDLIPIEQFARAATQTEGRPPLVIPVTAPLITGKRAVVYVKRPTSREERPSFVGRDVVLGHRIGDYYVVREGLKEGELVVTAGNFKIDADLQIQAKPSMMSHAGGKLLRVPDDFRRKLTPVYAAYPKLQQSLADDRLDDARAAWPVMRESLTGVPAETLDKRVGRKWQEVRKRLRRSLAIDVSQADVDLLRKRFEDLAAAMLETADVFGQTTGGPLCEVFCPMAFNDRGAAWLQRGRKIANPYFGHRMLRCGKIRRTFAPLPADVTDEKRDEEDSP